MSEMIDNDLVSDERLAEIELEEDDETPEHFKEEVRNRPH